VNYWSNNHICDIFDLNSGCGSGYVHPPYISFISHNSVFFLQTSPTSRESSQCKLKQRSPTFKRSNPQSFIVNSCWDPKFSQDTKCVRLNLWKMCTFLNETDYFHLKEWHIHKISASKVWIQFITQCKHLHLQLQNRTYTVCDTVEQCKRRWFSNF